MNIRNRTALLVLVMLALPMAPLASRATHCAEIFIGTGSFDGDIPGSGTTGRPNLGGFGPCSPLLHLDTNVITPGATFARVAAEGTRFQPALNGRVKFNDGAFHDFEWTHDGTFWLGPIIPIPDGTTRITATAITTNTGPPVPQTITYRAAGS